MFGVGGCCDYVVVGVGGWLLFLLSLLLMEFVMVVVFYCRCC